MVPYRQFLPSHLCVACCKTQPELVGINAMRSIAELLLLVHKTGVGDHVTRAGGAHDLAGPIDGKRLAKSPARVPRSIADYLLFSK